MRFTTSITDSILCADQSWPRLSHKEQVKRLQFIMSLFQWLKQKGWIDRDPSWALVTDDSDKKRRKGANAERSVPIHPLLISLGLIEWRTRLLDAGYNRLFPELKHDRVKGFGKAPTKWFSAYLRGLGWARDGRKVFHSFRSTLATECIVGLKLTPLETAHISGHSRGSGTLMDHYVKDELPDEFVKTVQRLDFGLPNIAHFDCEAGLKAVSDAQKRKDRARGAVED